MIVSEKSLRKIIAEEIQKALQVEITWKKMRDDKTNQPLPHPEIKTEKSDLSALLHLYIPRIEGAILGMQEDVDRTKNRVIQNTESLQAVAQIFLGLENSIKAIAQISHELKQLVPVEEIKRIGEKCEGNIGS